MLLLAFTACQLLKEPTTSPSTPAAPAAPSSATITTSASAGLLMSQLNTESSSLYFAGLGGETELREYNLHRIESILSELDSVDRGGEKLGAPTREALTSSIAGLRAATDATTFQTAYDAYVAACNSCHASTGMAFLKVTTPRVPPWSNVSFGHVARGAMGMGGGGMGPGGMGAGRPGAPGAEGQTPTGEDGEDEGARQRPMRPGGGMRPGGMRGGGRQPQQGQ